MAAKLGKLVPWMLISVSAAGGALLGWAYIALIVLPPISIWNAAHPGSDWQTSVLWYYYLAAVMTGAIFGVSTGGLAWLLGWLGRKWSSTLLGESLGVGLGAVLGVVSSYCYFQLQDSHLRPIAYPAVISAIAVVVLVSLTIVVRQRMEFVTAEG